MNSLATSVKVLFSAHALRASHVQLHVSARLHVRQGQISFSIFFSDDLCCLLVNAAEDLAE